MIRANGGGGCECDAASRAELAMRASIEAFAHRFFADDIIRAGCETLKQLQEKKTDVPSKFFTNED